MIKMSGLLHTEFVKLVHYILIARSKMSKAYTRGGAAAVPCSPQMLPTLASTRVFHAPWLPRIAHAKILGQPSDAPRAGLRTSMQLKCRQVPFPVVFAPASALAVRRATTQGARRWTAAATQGCKKCAKIKRSRWRV